VVGIAGGPEKCAFVAGELGADAAIDYKAEPDLSAAIARACPDGVDLYFDNVGGPTLDAALELCLRLQRGAACGAGGVMAWGRGRGEGARGR
jgi:NADPH-dependent curcumin reductase CurA